MQKTQDLTQAQVERTERAQSAILAGKFQVTRTNPCLLYTSDAADE